jgi:hypothetical protein
MNPMYAPLILDPARSLATSALPDAPVVADRREAVTTHAAPVRRVTAGLLRQLADRVEPRPALG